MASFHESFIREVFQNFLGDTNLTLHRTDHNAVYYFERQYKNLLDNIISGAIILADYSCRFGLLKKDFYYSSQRNGERYVPYLTLNGDYFTDDNDDSTFEYDTDDSLDSSSMSEEFVEDSESSSNEDYELDSTELDAQFNYSNNSSGSDFDSFSSDDDDIRYNSRLYGEQVLEDAIDYTGPLPTSFIGYIQDRIYNRHITAEGTEYLYEYMKDQVMLSFSQPDASAFYRFGVNFNEMDYIFKSLQAIEDNSDNEAVEDTMTTIQVDGVTSSSSSSLFQSPEIKTPYIIKYHTSSSNQQSTSSSSSSTNIPIVTESKVTTHKNDITETNTYSNVQMSNRSNESSYTSQLTELITYEQKQMTELVDTLKTLNEALLSTKSSVTEGIPPKILNETPDSQDILSHEKGSEIKKKKLRTDVNISPELIQLLQTKAIQEWKQNTLKVVQLQQEIQVEKEKTLLWEHKYRMLQLSMNSIHNIIQVHREDENKENNRNILNTGSINKSGTVHTGNTGSTSSSSTTMLRKRLYSEEEEEEENESILKTDDDIKGVQQIQCPPSKKKKSHVSYNKVHTVTAMKER